MAPTSHCRFSVFTTGHSTNSFSQRVVVIVETIDSVALICVFVVAVIVLFGFDQVVVVPVSGFCCCYGVFAKALPVALLSMTTARSFWS